MVEICAIVAMDNRGAIGRANSLPWKLSDDFKFFKETTKGHPVIMGRNTWNSLPKRPLIDRYNIVLGSDMSAIMESNLADTVTNNTFAAHDISMRQAQRMGVKRVFVIGGAQVYKAMLPLINTFYATHVDVEVEDADAFMPSLPSDLSEDHEVIHIQSANDKNSHSFKILKYKREYDYN